MNHTFVKICGLRTRQEVQVAVHAGADAIGFVFVESPRRISVDDAVEITEDVPDSVLRVAVMREPSAQQWKKVAEGFRPDCLQMEAANFARISLSPDVSALPVYRDQPELREDAIASESRILFEGPNSGQGQLADWARARRLARKTQLVLAGGLHIDNVVPAIEAVHPWGVDVSSGVERNRGVKDLHKIEAFVNAVRNMDSMHADPD